MPPQEYLSTLILSLKPEKNNALTTLSNIKVTLLRSGIIDGLKLPSYVQGISSISTNIVFGLLL